MNALKRTFIEKTGNENGWENIIEGEPHAVVPASARHHAQVRITLADAG